MNQITQTDADELLAMEKHKVDDQEYQYPDMGGKLAVELKSPNGREKFILDISRRKIELSRNKFQTRARETLVLVRLDLSDTPHRNPDGEEVAGPHLHLYREGFGDSWAYPLSPEIFTEPDSCMRTLEQFMNYCTITNAPNILGGLFT